MNALPAPRLTDDPPAFVPRITSHGSLAAVQADWRALEPCAWTIYQTFEWCRLWSETIGAQAGVTPLILVVRDPDGAPRALLPLGVRKTSYGRIADFLGGNDANYKAGLFGDDVEATGLWSLVRGAARAARVDALALTNQPHAWGLRANPLAALPHQPSPSFAYSGSLAVDLSSALSNKERKKLRASERRLAVTGTLVHVQAPEAALAAHILEAALAQKRALLAGRAAPSDAAAAFLHQGVAEGVLRVDALMLGERIIAAYIGAVHQGRYYGMVNAYDPAFARSSPGVLLLMKLVEARRREGVTTIDLGIGEARYKSLACPTVEPLFDSYLGVSGKGAPLAAALAARGRAKRWIKHTPWAYALARRLVRG